MSNPVERSLQGIEESEEPHRYTIPGGKEYEIRAAPSQQDFLELCEKLEDEEVELAARLAARAALRPQEIRELQEEDVVIEQQTIQLQIRSGDRIHYRTVPVQKYERLEKLLLKNGDESGKLISADINPTKEIRKTKGELEIPGDVQLHLQGLRYTAIIDFFRRGLPYCHILSILGRNSTGKLLHLQEQVTEEISDRFEQK